MLHVNKRKEIQDFKYLLFNMLLVKKIHLDQHDKLAKNMYTSSSCQYVVKVWIILLVNVESRGKVLVRIEFCCSIEWQAWNISTLYHRFKLSQWHIYNHLCVWSWWLLSPHYIATYFAFSWNFFATMCFIYEVNHSDWHRSWSNVFSWLIMFWFVHQCKSWIHFLKWCMFWLTPLIISWCIDELFVDYNSNIIYLGKKCPRQT